MKIRVKKKIGFALLVIGAVGLSVWLSQAVAQVNPPHAPLVLVDGLLSARRALDGEVKLAFANNVTTLIRINEQAVSHLPKLKQVLDGADIRHQQRMEWCAIRACDEGGPDWPSDLFERRSTNAIETSTIIASFTKFDYFQERVEDNGAKVFRFHQIFLEYNGKFYIVTIHSLLQS